MESRLLRTVGIMAVVGLTGMLAAQAPASPAFEVASIKPNVGGPQSGLTQFRGGRYITRYRTVKELIRFAYGAGGRSLPDRQIVGAPTWLGVDRFDIEATAPGVPDDSRGMIPIVASCALVSTRAPRFSPQSGGASPSSA